MQNIGIALARAFASSLSKPRQAIRRSQPVHLLVDIGEMPNKYLQQRQNIFGGGGAAQQQQGRDGAGAGGLKQNDGIKATAQHQIISKSQWLDWTRWSRCENSERIRVRKCLSINGTSCEGPSIEKQSCFSAVSSDIKFAKDPIIIEREIRGDILHSHRRFVAKN